MYAAAIVMRAVRNTVDTGRTVVCTIHQPSIDIVDVSAILRTGPCLTLAAVTASRAAVRVLWCSFACAVWQPKVAALFVLVSLAINH